MEIPKRETSRADLLKSLRRRREYSTQVLLN